MAGEARDRRIEPTRQGQGTTRLSQRAPQLARRQNRIWIDTWCIQTDHFRWQHSTKEGIFAVKNGVYMLMAYAHASAERPLSV